MKNTAARTILGLEPDDDPRAFLSAFEETRQFKQELVNNAPNEEIKFRYQQELLEYEAAVKVVAGSKKARPNTDFIIVLLLIASFSAVGWWGYQWYQKEWNEHSQTQLKIAELQSQGRIAVVSRKWQEAEKVYRSIEELDPGSSIAANGMKAIKQGKAEEVNQQMFYTLGESQAALEAGRWNEAEKLARQVLGIDPNNLAAKRKLEIIAAGRLKQEISVKMLAITESLEQGDLPAARNALAGLRAKDPNNPNLPAFLDRIQAEQNKIREREQQALKLFAKAQKLDTGEYSSEALDLLSEARRLFPTHQGILSLHKKMGAYTRALEVPVDFPTINKALASARAGDLIRVAPGVYQEALVLHKPVRIEGAPKGKTVIELPGQQAALITITPEATETSLTSLKLRHTGYDHSKERFSAVTIMAADVSMRDCTIENAAGHGIAVIQGGSVRVIGCQISECGWDGISVYGQGSEAQVLDSRLSKNLHHGINFWQGGKGDMTSCFFIGNSLCGVMATDQGVTVNVTKCTSSQNREAGILVSNGSRAVLTSSKSENNLLSGIVARGEGTQIKMTGNLTRKNRQAGILIHKSVQVTQFEKNTSHGNIGRQIWQNAELK